MDQVTQPRTIGHGLRPVAENVWIVDAGRIKAAGLPLPIRMTVIRLSSGALRRSLSVAQGRSGLVSRGRCNSFHASAPRHDAVRRRRGFVAHAGRARCALVTTFGMARAATAGASIN